MEIPVDSRQWPFISNINVTDSLEQITFILISRILRFQADELVLFRIYDGSWELIFRGLIFMWPLIYS